MERWTMKQCPNCGLLWPQRLTACERCAEDLPESTLMEVVKAHEARSSDPDTSKLAALRQRPRSGTQRARILEAVSNYGPMTAREIEAFTGIHCAWKRVSELRAGDFLHAAATVHDEETGTDVTSYDVGPAQRAMSTLFEQ